MRLSSWVAIALVALVAGCADSPTRPPQLNPLPGAKLSSAFGPRPVDPVTGKETPDSRHDGYDLAAPAGTPIRAAEDGRVEAAGPRGGYGIAALIGHAEGWSTLYGHASKLVVKPGERVRAGQVIGYVGSTGHSTGPHLHYELRRYGRAVDPLLAATFEAHRAKASRSTKPTKLARKAKPRPAKTAKRRSATLG